VNKKESKTKVTLILWHMFFKDEKRIKIIASARFKYMEMSENDV
jgi:hypothetical protein